MRFSSRAFAALCIAAGVSACTDSRTIDSPIPPGMHAARIALNPVFASTGAAAAIGDFGLTFDRVRVAIRNNPDTTKAVLDTTVSFSPTSQAFALNLTVPVFVDHQIFNALVQYIGPSGVIFSGSVLVQSYSPDEPAPEEQSLTLTFVGPGSKLKTISVSPDPVNLVGTQTVALTVTATDSSGAAVASPPIAFTSSDATVATASASGATFTAQSFGKRGSARLIAITPTGIADTLTAVVTLPPAAIVLVSGGGQSATIGTTLASPAVVQVNASDGVAVPGASVTFSAPTGGSVGTATATTDANGRASTSLTLGSTAGAQNFTATVGSFSVTIPETGTPQVLDHFDVTKADGTPLGPTQTAGTPLAVKITAKDVNNTTIAAYTGAPTVRVTNTTFANDTVEFAPAAVAGVSTITTVLGRPAANATIDVTGTLNNITRVSHSAVFTVIVGPPAKVEPFGPGDVVVNFTSSPVSSMIYPSVRVSDGASNPVVGATVRFAAVATPAGSGSPICQTIPAGGTSATTNASGVITLDARTLTYPANPAGPYSCVVRVDATVDGSAGGQPVSGSPLPIALVTTTNVANFATWTGRAKDNVWSNGGNWLNSTVPTGSFQAFLPWATAPLATPPKLSAATAVSSIDVEDGAGLDLNAQTLTVSQTVQARKIGQILNGTIGVAVSANGGLLSGILPNFNCSSGVYTLVGNTTFTGTINNSNCSINVNNDTLRVNGNYIQTGGAALVMTHAGDLMAVLGNVAFGGGAQSGELTAGALAVGGNFTQTGTNGSFAATATHTVTIAPVNGATQPQTVSFIDAVGSFFQRLNVFVGTSAPTTFSTAVSVKDSLTINGSGTVNFNAGMGAQQNGGIVLAGTSVALNFNGGLNARSLTFTTGSTTTLTGNMNITMANGSIFFRAGSHVTVNTTGTTTQFAQCIKDPTAIIDGPSAGRFSSCTTLLP